MRSSIEAPFDILIPVPSKSRRPKTAENVRSMSGGYCHSILHAKNNKATKGFGKDRQKKTNCIGNNNSNNSNEMIWLSFHQKEPNIMLAARQHRVRAEAEMRLLQNRLQHLKLEENKALDKAKKTMERAKEIETIKKKRQEEANRKLQLLEHRECGEQSSKLDMKKSIMDHKDKMLDAKRRMEEKKKAAATRVKQMKKDMSADLLAQQDEDYKRVRYRNFIIRSQREELRRKKEESLHRRIENASSAYASKVASEARRTTQMEDLLRQMEQEESQLIERVKAAQQTQTQAYSSLHDAVELPVTKSNQRESH